MPVNRQQFTLQINADTSQAKKAMQDLTSSFNNLYKAQSNANFMNDGLNKAVESAKELQIHLQKAMNVNTGQLNLNVFNQSLEQSKTSFKELSQSLLSGGAAGQQTFLSLASAIAQSEVPLKQMNSTLRNFATTLKNTVKWEISSNIVHGLEGALQGAVSYAKGLNESLTNIRIVTGQSVDDMARFAQQANRAAKELSTTTKAYSDAALIYYQQGDTDEMVAKKAAITIKAANASFGSSAAEMSEYLTAVWNSYQVGADELERYVDIMAALGAKTATSLEEIATSMQKVAATGNTVGVSMEQVSSIIATVSSVTRESAESIGTSYKTIFARMGDLKLGATDEDNIGLGQVSSALDSIGVKVLDANGQLRDMGDIITDLGNKWQTMDNATKTAVAQVVAGKRQYTQLMALFENWDMYNANLDIAGNAEGSLQQMADTYAESWDAASARVRASLEDIYSKILNDQAIIKFTDGVSKAVDGISALMDSLGGMPGILAMVGQIGMKVFQTQIASAIDQTVSKMGTYFSQFKGQGILSSLNKIGTGKTKTVEQIKSEQINAKYEQEMNQLKNRFGADSSEYKAVSSAQELLKYKQQLLDVENQLSGAEKIAAQNALNDLSQQQAGVVALIKEREKLTEQIQRENKEAKSDIYSLVPQKSGERKMSLSEKTNYINESLQLGQQENFKLGNFNSLFDYIQKTGKFKDGLKLDDIFSLGENFSRTSTMIDGFLENIDTGADDVDILKEKIAKMLGEELKATNLKDLKKELQDIQNNADQLADDLAELVKDSFVDEVNEGDLRKAILERLSKVQISGAEKASIDLELNFKQSSIDKAKKVVEDLMNPKSQSYSALANFMTKAAQAAGALTSGLSTGSNVISTFKNDASTLADKLSSAAGAASSLAMGFGTGGWLGLAASVVGMIIGAINSAKKAQEELIQKQREQERSDLNTNLQSNKAEIDSIKSLVSEFNSLYAQKQQGADVDRELASIATELANKYDITGVSVANLTGNYENLLEKLRQISSGDFSEISAVDATLNAAKKDLEESKRLLSESGSGLSGNGKGYTFEGNDENRQRIKNAWEKGYTYGQDEQFKFTAQSWFDTYEFKGGFENVAIGKNAQGKGLTFRDLIQSIEGLDDYFISEYDGRGNSWAELLLTDNTTAEYKYDLYNKLQELQQAMKDAGVDLTNGYYTGISNIITSLKDDVDRYKDAVGNFNEAIVAKQASRFSGLNTETYNFSSFWKDYQDVVDVFENSFEGENDGIGSLAIEATDTIVALNSNLNNYSLVLKAAYEMYGDLTKAGALLAAMSDLGYDVSSFDNYDLIAIDIGDKEYLDNRKGLKEANKNLTKAQELYTSADTNKSLLKEDMTYEEAQKLYEAYNWGEDGLVSFEDFIKEDYDGRKQILESAADSYLAAMRESVAIVEPERQAAVESQKQLTEAWLDKKGMVRGTMEQILAYRANIADELSNVVNILYTQDEDGIYVLKEEFDNQEEKIIQALTEAGVARGPEFFADLTQYLQDNEDKNVKDWEEQYLQNFIKQTYGLSQEDLNTYSDLLFGETQANEDLKALDKLLAIIELLDQKVYSTTTKFTKMGEAIKQLPTNANDLKMLAEELGYMNELDEISIESLMQSTSIDRARRFLENAEKPVQPGENATDTEWATYQEQLYAYNQSRNAALETIYASSLEALEKQQDEWTKIESAASNAISTIAGLTSITGLSNADLTNLKQNFIDLGKEDLFIDYTNSLNALDKFSDDYTSKVAQLNANILSELAYAKQTTLKEQKINLDEINNLTEETINSGLVDAQIFNLYGQAKSKLDENATIEEIRAKMRELANEINTKIDIDINLNEAELKDTWLNLLNSIFGYEEATAQKTYNLWKSTFDAIAKARDGLASGKSIIETMFGDPEALGIVMKQMAQNLSYDQIMSNLYNGNYNYNNLGFTNQTTAYERASGYSRYFNYNGQGELLETTAKQFVQNIINTAINGDDMIKNALSANNINLENAIQMSNTEEGLTKLFDILNFNFDDSYWSALGQQIAQKYQQSSTIFQQDLSDAQNRANIEQQKQTTAETQKAAIDAAIAALSSGQVLTTLDAAQQAILKDYFGTDNLDEIGLESLTSASDSLAGVLLQLANTIADIFNLNAAGWTQNADGTWSKGDETITANEVQAWLDKEKEARDKANTQAIEASQNRENNLNTIASNYASFAGVSVEELKTMADTLSQIEGNASASTESLYGLASATIRAEKAVEELKSSGEDLIKTLRQADKTSTQYASALTKMKQNMAKLFNTKEAFISDKFVEANLDNMEKIATGTEEEAKAAADAISKALALEILGEKANLQVNIDVNSDGVVNGLDNVGNMLSSFADQYANTPIGVTIDDAPAIDALNNLMWSGQMTAEEIQAALNAIGWQPEVEMQEYELTEKDVGRGYVRVPITDPITGKNKGYGNYPISSDYQAGQTIRIPKIGKNGTTGITGLTKVGSGSSSVRPTTPSGGGGGGGGGEPKQIDAKQPEDEIDRYHHVKEQIERLNEAMTKNDKIKDRLYGKGRLEYLEKEIALTEKSIDLQKQYLSEALGWLEIDKERVESIGAAFDDEGNIANYEELMQSLLAEYNAFVEGYNAASAELQKTMDEEKEQWDKWYQERVEWIKKYEETVQLVNEKQNDILEAQNKISSLKLETIQYKIEVHMDVSDMEKDFLDYLNDKYEDVLESQDKVMENLIRQQEIAAGNLEVLGQARSELEAAYASGELNQADYIEGLKDINAQILDNLESLEKLRREIEELYGNTLDLAGKEFDRQIAKIDNAAKAMSSYISILRLMGHEVDYEMLGEFYEQQYEYNLKSIESQRAYLDLLKEEQEYYLSRIRSGEELTETERKQYEALAETIDETQAKILETTQNTLQVLQEKWQNTVSSIIKDLEESVVGAGNSINWMSEQYGRYQQVLDRYAAAHKEVYEISKLNRTIEDELSKARTTAYKNELKQFQDLINAKSKNNQLSEYQLEHMQLELELILKRQALLDAQNAKDTVRLTRDSAGNYIYQYTADQDKMNEAQQAVEDVLYQLAELEYNTVHDLESSLIRLQQEAQEAIEQILLDTTLTAEQKQERIAEITKFYMDQQKYYADQLDIVLKDQQVTQGLHMEHYGEMMQQNLTKTSTGLSGILTDMQLDSEQFEAIYNDILKRINDKLVEFDGQIQQVKETSGLSYEEMVKSIGTYNEVVDDAQEETKELIGVLRDQLNSVHTLTSAWDSYQNSLRQVITQYEQMYQAIMRVMQAESQRAAQQAMPSVTPTTPNPGSVNSSSTPKPSGTTSSSNSGSGSGGGAPSGSSGSAGTTEVKTGTLILKSVNQDTGNTIKTVKKEGQTPGATMAAAWQSYTGISSSDYNLVNMSPSQTNIYAGKETTITYYYKKKSSSGSSTGGCFVAGTKVIMADESIKNIEDVKIGEYVIAYNEIEDKFEPKKVVKSYAHHDTPRVLEITFSNGIKLGITPGHPFLTATGWKSRDIENSLWEHGVEATWLEIGDEIISYNNNSVKVVDIKELNIPEHYDTYNLTVETCHTYMVEGLVVHNAKVADDRDSLRAYAAGGLNTVTGPAWLDGTKANPELVLNADDTRNILAATSIIRTIDRNTLDAMDNFINQSTQNMMTNLGSITASYSASVGSDTLEQEVHITAEFPNVTNSNEIQDAFDNLINRATQFITTKK